MYVMSADMSMTRKSAIPITGDPDNGIEPGTAWEDIPDDWVCPLCGVGKDEFSKVE